MVIAGLCSQVISLKGTSTFFFLPHHVACGILVPQPGIEPGPPALEDRSLNHWTTREVLELQLLILMNTLKGILVTGMLRASW